LPLVVDASVGLKWVLEESDSHLARALAVSDEALLVPDFWLNEACNVLWLQVRRKVFTPDEAREGLGLLRAQVEPTSTADLGLHDVALEIGLATNHSTYDTLYVAFALAMGADKVVVADESFIRDMQTHPDPAVTRMLLPLSEWAVAGGLRA
jgi:predicted nucleic acid-binding protein